MVPMVEAGSTAEKVHNREEFRQLLNDVTKLPESQRARAASPRDRRAFL